MTSATSPAAMNYPLRGGRFRNLERHLLGEGARASLYARAFPKGAFVLFGVLFAAQHNDP
jgi:hypothetical protein